MPPFIYFLDFCTLSTKGLIQKNSSKLRILTINENETTTCTSTEEEGICESIENNPDVLFPYL